MTTLRTAIPVTLLLLAPVIKAAAPATAPSLTEMSGVVDDIGRAKSGGVTPDIYKLYRAGPAADVLVPQLMKYAIGDGSPESRRRVENAVSAIGMIGSQAALNALVQLIDDEQAVAPALKALLSCGEPAIRPLVALLLRTPEIDRNNVIWTIYRIGGPAANQSLNRLPKQLTLPANQEIAKLLADQLRRYTADRLLPELRKGSNNLSGLAETGLTGLDSCLAMLGDADPAIRLASVSTAEQLLLRYGTFDGPDRARAIVNTHKADIQRALADSDSGVFRVAKAFAPAAGIDASQVTWKPAPPRDLPTRPLTRLEQIEKLVKDKGAAAEPELRQVIGNDPDYDLRYRVAELLLGIPPVDQRLDKALRGDDPTLQFTALRKIVRQGETGWRTLFTIAGETDISRYASIIPESPDKVGVRVALAVLDGDDSKAFLPATLVVANAFVPGGMGQPRPSEKNIAKMCALLDDKDPAKRRLVSKALMRMPEVVTGPVSKLLTSADLEVRRSAAVTLAGEGSDSPLLNRLPALALDPLLAAAKDADQQVRENAAIGLVRLLDTYDKTKGRENERIKALPAVRDRALKQLHSMWNDADAEVRGASVYFLAYAVNGSDELQLAQKHPDRSVSVLADYLYRSIYLSMPNEPASLPSVSEAVDVLNDARHSTRTKTIIAKMLTRHGKDASPAIPSLIAQLGPTQPINLRKAAAEALGAAGQGSPQAAAGLIAALDDPEPGVVAFVIRSIGEIGPAAEAAVPRLLSIIDKGASLPASAQQQQQASAAFDSLAGIGRTSVPGLITLLQRGDRVAVWKVTEQLRRIGPDAAPAVPALLKLLQQKPTGPQVVSVVKAIGAIGPGAKGAVPALTARFAGATFEERRILTEALGDIGPAAATPAVIGVLISPGEHGSTDTDGIIALGKMGPAAVSAVPSLIKIIRTATDRSASGTARPGEGVSFSFGHAEQQAVRVLGKIGSRASLALPTLQNALTVAISLGDKSTTAVITQAQARILGKQPLNSADDFGPN